MQNNMRQKEKYDIIIGIDPDATKSGIAELYISDRVYSISEGKNFFDLATYLQDVSKINPEKVRVKVIIEGGWLNQSNWHVLSHFMSTRKAAAIGRSTGMNHQTGLLIAEMCKGYGLNYEVVKPLKKCWKGRDGKITQQELESFTGKLPRMNQDVRDACLLAWVYAELPIRVSMQQVMSL